MKALLGAETHSFVLRASLELVRECDLRLIWVDRLRWIAEEARRQSGDERREHEPTAVRCEILEKRGEPREIFDLLPRQL
jgi:hypothetical protein